MTSLRARISTKNGEPSIVGSGLGKHSKVVLLCCANAGRGLKGEGEVSNIVELCGAGCCITIDGDRTEFGAKNGGNEIPAATKDAMGTGSATEVDDRYLTS